MSAGAWAGVVAGVAAGAVAAAFVTLQVARGPAPPVVNQARAGAMRPAITAYLARHAASLGAGDLAREPELKSRVFCTYGVVEIQRTGSQWHVGMSIRCGEFARRDGLLIEGTTGYVGDAEVMTLTRAHGRYRARSLLVGPESRDARWVRHHFSPGGAYEIDNGSNPVGANPIRQAWRYFHFPRGTKPVQD